MNNFDNIISFENLYKAHRRARLGKRHKKEVIEFEGNLSENIWRIHYDLKYGKYMVGGYHSFMIYDPKEREIQAISYRDRVVQHSLCDNYLIPILEKHLIYDNAACRKNKGTSFAIKRWREFMRRHYLKYGDSGYFIRVDVAKYFPSIDHTILKEKLVKIVEDKKVLELLYSIIDSYNLETNKGLPMGNQTSQCFALLYLDNVDRYIKETMRIKHYVRYMDDMMFIVHDKQLAKLIIDKVKFLFEECGLSLNKQSKITPVKNGVAFLGWRFSYNETGGIIQTLKKETQKIIIKRIKKKYFLKSLCENSQPALSSYYGYLKNGNSYHFYKKIKKVMLRKENENEH